MTTSATLLPEQKACLIKAATKIAPSWPLDKLIAVNPLWSHIAQSFDHTSDELSALAGIKTHLSLDTYLAWFQQGRIQQAALHQAAEHYQLDTSADDLVSQLSQATNVSSQWRNIADLADQYRPANKMSWHDEITHQVSQFCAAHYQEQSPTLRQKSANQDLDLYAHWREITIEDKGLSILMGEANLSDYFRALPSNQDDMSALVIHDLSLNHLACENSTLDFYAHALLLDINGWSSYLAYLNDFAHQAPEAPNENHVASLLAIKMAWGWVVWCYLKDTNNATFKAIERQWQQQSQHRMALIEQHQAAHLSLKVWAMAFELSEQNALHRTLLSIPVQKTSSAQKTPPALQAVFCIDVRSEVFRRALEAQSHAIQTFGFAGFFGLPIEYRAKDSQFTRPQLPGLLQASITVTETESDDQQVHHQQQEARWHRWGHAAPASFSMVESMGWWYAFKMFKQTLFSKQQANPVNRLAPNTAWTLQQKGRTLSPQDKADLAMGILTNMGIQDYADTVLLVGHGSQTSNNLHAAGLECGACGGQSGEVNVKVLASLLNDPQVRVLLNHMEANIPATTQFVAAMHNTTTDQLTCYDHQPNAAFSGWFEQAMYAAQKERALLLDPTLVDVSNKTRHKAFLQRANDWSQVRPEWGLANNHSFIIAPREKTRSMNLHGRSFLHDYQAKQDPDFATLEKLITAPMLVAHWINMQYNLSVTDNFKFGSGDKVLHNAVGGNIGVFEGNGGDLRIGLSKQSLHDGERWMHTPVRLAVYIDAPQQAIADIIAKHELVRHLVDNDWLYLYQWQDQTLSRYYQGHWSNEQGHWSNAQG
ncbi:DUF2309 domain-containing protein [Marinomonas sp. A79]|uniref:Probable inorganic carbon transporter subunit DabA n=1 Tax=Marinomonas vulgaris TaxID=2823372 RepID=A0ABS5HBU4_9GAMM|nr:DUF2309 domain-containing protein [Marinomonas vulgaris]MBR7889133.1 DUF2309 domain-containing protein [Marinomonas vulgaris]